MSGKRQFEDVADQIAALIDEGALPPGVRLPGERDLATRFGVSRLTIREAEIVLQALGRLEARNGSGLYVSEGRHPALAALPNATAVEVAEAHLLVESEAAALAAHNIAGEDGVADDVEELASLVDHMSDDDQRQVRAADEEFHLRLAEASNNLAIMHTVRGLWQMRRQIPQVRRLYEQVYKRDAEVRLEEHQAILDAIQEGDSGGARTAMRDHFQRIIGLMLDIEEKQALKDVRRKASESRERFLVTATMLA